MRPFRTYFATFLLCATSAIASADPTWVQWADNGHYYAVIVEPAGISWTDADAAAQALDAHLVSINSAAENAFVFSLIDDAQYWKPHTSFTGVDFNIGPWIGGYQPETAIEPNVGWQWSSNEQFNFTAWVPGEPNEGPIPGQLTENRICYWIRGSLTDRGSEWNDFHDGGCWEGDCVIAYVIEQGCVTTTIAGPLAQSICPGGTASFNVTPAGAGPFTYHWQKGSQPLVDDAHISGSDTDTLTVTGATATDAGLYACLIGDSCGPVLSAAAELLISTVSIDGPSDQNVCPDGIAIFSVFPAGPGPFTYAWKKGGQPLADDAHMTGSDTATLTITGVTATDVDSYACLVTDFCGPVLSAAANLLIIPAISVDGPSAESVCPGGTATFTVAPIGPGPFTYAWQKDGQPLVDDAHIAGSTEPTLTITGAAAADADSYACLVADSCGSVLSTAATLSIVPAISIDGPSAQTVCNDGTAIFTVTPTGAGPFTYAWQKGVQPVIDDAHITGSSTATLTITGVTAADVDSYACLVTNSCGPVLSAAADLLVIPAVNIDGPSSQSVCAGSNASFTVTVTPVGSGPHTYAWQKGGQASIDDAHIAGSHDPTLAITGVTAADVDSYACLITGPCGSLLSAAADLSIIPAVSIDGPMEQTLCAGGIASFTVTPTGSGPFTFAWKKGGQPLVDDAHITGSSTTTVTINGATAADMGSYACVVTDPCGPVLSTSADLLVIPTGTGDGDASGTVNGLDIAGFVAAVTGSPSATPGYCAFDMNVNGTVNADDLPAFVAILLAP